MKVYKCEDCGKEMVVFHHDMNDKKLHADYTEITANTSDGAKEKHLPIAEIKGNIVKVTVGSTPHPQTDTHSISWVALMTEEGEQIKTLKPEGTPEVTFALTDTDKPVSVYAFCNLHGLWMVEI